MISADRMKSVRMAPLTMTASWSGPWAAAGAAFSGWWPVTFS